MKTILVAGSNGRSRATLFSRWSRLALSLLVLGLPLCANVAVGAGLGHSLASESRYPQRFSTRHAQHQSLPLKSGDVVRNGQLVALVQNQERSTAAHRDVGAYRHGRSIDPVVYLHYAGR